ncbi:MAG: hypothetical protein QOF89_6202 [Acidobacteriota bacterium]|nr:hypothetical protein [Acidobacteriota bacterium]
MSDISARLAGLSPQRRELLLRQLAARQAPAAADRIPRQPRSPEAPQDTGRFPLSFSQLREWLLEQLDPGTPAYNMPGGARVLGPLDLDALRRSVGEIVRRHESLRTTFEPGAGEPVQVVASMIRVEIPLLDLSALPPQAREAEAARLVAAERRLPFDLARGPLLRFFVLRLGPEDHLAPFSMHHIVSDGWSIGLFFQELVALYEAFSTGAASTVSPLLELPIQYPDFAVWQRERLQGELMAEQVGYWRDQLAGSPPLLPLPTDRPRPPVQRLRGARTPMALSADLIRAARALGQREGASLFMVLLAAFQALLARWTGVDDVPVGTFSGNRGRAELEKLIGFFINTLVLRTRLEDAPGFGALVARVRDVTLGAFAHQEVPFEKLLEELRLDRDLSHTPLFQALLLVQNFPLETVELSRVRLAPLVEEGSPSHVNFDLELILSEVGDEVRGMTGYNAELFDAGTIERLNRHLTALLAAALKEPERSVYELPLLSPAELKQLLGDWSGVAVSPDQVPHPVSLLFAVQAARTPEAVAVEHEGMGTTYRELEERSNRLARFLRRLGVGPETVVGVAADRSSELMTGLLATLKAGGAYLPLDPDYPPERLAWMLEDAGASLLLTRRHLASRWPEVRTVLLDGGEWEAEDSAPLSGEIKPGHAAYVLYTSGSTGRPKGVVVEHRSLAAYTLDAAAAYGLAPGERALQFASISFDTSAEEIYPALVTGATLVLRPESMLDSIPRFLAELDRLGITVLNLPTAYWHELAGGLEGRALPWGLRRVILGGERALPEALVQWRQGATGHPARLVNTYGPTETTIVVTRHELADVEDPAMGIPIGRPIPGARVYVVDPRLQPVPPGVAGELLVGGTGLSRGYLGRPDLTAAAFAPDPFGEIPGNRLYRTGDLVRFRSGGVLEFLGRIDGQVKIRGFRVETGEIESALTAHPRVRTAAVTLREDAPGSPGLVAYVVPAGEPGSEPPTTSELRRFLAGRLPEHMMPAAFMILESLPLTGSGKVDRRALPRPDGERPRLEREYLPPASEVEEALVEIWAETLGIARVGVQDNFFELGGHSLLATQVITRIRERLRIDLPLIALFQMPTVEHLAVVVEEKILDLLEALEDAEVQALVSPRA